MGTRDYSADSITPDEARRRAEHEQVRELVRELAREQIEKHAAEIAKTRRASPPFEG